MSNKNITEFSLRLKYLREAAGITKNTLAARVGVSAAYIGQLEGMTEETRKKPSKPLLDKLAQVLDVNSVWLETGEGDKFENVSAEPNAQDMLPDPARMTLEQKLQWLGFKTKDIRQMQEWSKLSEEEQDEELRRLCNQNLEKGRY